MPYTLASSLFFAAAAQADQAGGTPLWVLAILVVLVLLLFWWGLARPALTDMAEGESEAEATATDAGEAAPAAEGEPAAPATMAESPEEKAVDQVMAEEEAAGGDEAAAETTAQAMAETPPEPDDLERLEGIGPKIQKILNEAGYFTYADLAAADSTDLRRVVIEEAGIRIATPDSWPEQAQLAADGDWEGLEELQGQLHRGRPR